jgi:ubiquinone/menaquinone biosynthesis C-methylase UbiE
VSYLSERKILRVKADKSEIKKMYAKFSKVFGLIEKSEKSLRKKALEMLGLKKREKVLEIGFGRGTTLVDIAKQVGDEGEIHGIDLTPEMVTLAREVFLRNKINNIEIIEGDARDLPYEKNYFDVVYIASTLELFDTPDIPVVLKEIRRVLKSSGRLCVISMPKEKRENTTGLKLYEWFHIKFPKYASCRPIYVENSIAKAGFKIVKKDTMGLFFPMKIVIALPVNKTNF